MTLGPATVVLLLCSLAFGQGQNADAVPQAKLVFYRVSGYAGTALHASIKIDSEEPVHKIENSHSWSTGVPAGSHFIFGDDRRYGRSYTLEAGKTYYFRVDAIMTPNRGRFRVLKVSPDIADAETWGLEAE